MTWILSNKGQTSSYKYREMDRTDRLAVTECFRQVLDKFPCHVMMTGQHAIFCSESLSVQQLVILYKLKYHQLTDMLADWMVQDFEIPLDTRFSLPPPLV